jgi:hypothetical protein
MSQISVLSLDGGGTFACVLALALERLFPSTTGRDILSKFDLVAANSGGSIVLAALLANFSPSDVAAFYSDPATVRKMYCPRWCSAFKNTFLRPLFPPYSSDGKRAALAKLLDDRCSEGERLPSSIPLAEWPSILGTDLALLITAYDYDSERGAFFRSTARAGDIEAERRCDVPIIDAVHASTQGPILYYGKPAAVAGRRYWDGGLAGYNNPVLAAVIEAMSEHPNRVDDIRVLSIGTGTIARAPYGQDAPRPFARATSTCLGAQLKKVAGAVLADPPCAATFHAHMALDGGRASETARKSHLVRLSPFVRPRRDQQQSWQPPRGLTTEEFKSLAGMKADTMRESDLRLIGKMSQLWIDGLVENEPVLISSSPSFDIGDRTFDDARAHWNAIQGDRTSPAAKIT